MFLLLLTACPEPPTPCDETLAGSLHIALDLPAETWEENPGVEVYDASGALLEWTSPDATLELPGGVYFVAARRGVVYDEVPGLAYGLLEDTVQQVCVGGATPTEWAGTWERQPSSGYLWMTSGEQVTAYKPDGTFDSSPVAAPVVDFQVPYTNDLRGITFDRFGNLWLATSPTYGARLLVYFPGSAVTGESAVEFGGELFADNVQIADLLFDLDLRLWVLVRGSGTGEVGLWTFSPAQVLSFLATGDIPQSPEHRFTVPGLVSPEDLFLTDRLRAPTGLAIADFGSNRIIVVDTDRAELATDDVLPQYSALSGTWTDGTGTHELVGPTDVAFDKEGFMWVNYWTSNIVARLPFAGVGEGDQTVAAVDTLALDVTDLPGGLELDRSLGLWFGNDAGAKKEIVHVDTSSGEVLQRAQTGGAPVDLHFDPEYRPH